MQNNNQIQIIENKIFSVRGQQVMLDRDLAELYQVETRVLNQAVTRNIDIFPERFAFQLTKEEFQNLKSQIVISNFQTLLLLAEKQTFLEIYQCFL